MFLWNCISNSLAVRMRLAERIDIDTVCPRYNNENEDVLHLLVACEKSREFWNLHQFGFDINSIPMISISSWFEEIRSRLDKNEFSRFLVCCWFLWYDRNKPVWSIEHISIEEIQAKAADFFARFQTSRCRLEMSKGPVSGSWVKPDVGQIKINVDASVDADIGCIGIGFVARNSDGVCIDFRIIHIPLPLNPECAEGLALLKAVEFGASSRWDNIVYESDCSSVVGYLRNKFIFDNGVGAYIQDILHITSVFPHFSFSSISRNFNSVAHELARIGRVENHNVITLPDNIVALIAFDSL